MADENPKTGAENAKGGRPKKFIDPQQVKTLAAIGCTMPEMALVLGCNERTLRRRFVRLINEGKLHAKVSLRRWMYEKAKGGSVAMQIFLSKQRDWLGFSDKLVATGADGGPIQHELTVIPDTELDREIDRLLKATGLAQAMGDAAEVGTAVARKGAAAGFGDGEG